MALGKVSALGATVCLGLIAFSQSAAAGPPFLTDDPEPTDAGHWEIYTSLINGAGRGTDFSGSAAVELDYGAAPDLQLTLAAPMAYSRAGSRWRWGAGDVALSAKYRVYHDEQGGLSVAAAPGVTLPTGTNGMSAGKVTALFPLWVQKDIGPWSVFGGGGYAIAGLGNRDYWTGGIAVTRNFGERLQLGIEANRNGVRTPDGSASTGLSIGATYQCKAPIRVFVSGGPTFEAAGGPTGFHGFAALGFKF